jgi:RimJ/RimL family protein N-acetyltransferase
LLAPCTSSDASQWSPRHSPRSRLSGLSCARSRTPTARHCLRNRNWRKCTIGYELHPSARGLGYVNEALRTVLPWGFRHMALNRVEALVHPSNAASLRSVEKLGFKREGLQRQVGYRSNQHHDMDQYSLLRREWPGQA